MFDLIPLVKTAGYLGLFGIIFAESGLFIGFFFPGDSLLFTAGFLASQGFFDIYILSTLMFIAAVVGDSVGYWFGRHIGPKLFNKEDSFLFHKDHLYKAQAFYEKHGGKAIILARFMPIVRTFAPILAGVGEMKYSRFILYNVIGGIAWGVCMPFLGYFLGTSIPDAGRYLFPIVIVIIITSLLPSAVHILRNKEHRQHIVSTVKNRIRIK